MKPIVLHRKGIPFFYQKTNLEFQQDIYERYHEMVIRQSALHLADNLWETYPFQPILEFAQSHYSIPTNANIVDIGCSVGRWIATLAKAYPKSTCWGIDYSYQMLKRANEFWVEGKEITIDLTEKGWSKTIQKGQQLENLKFGLAKAEHLPFQTESQDLVVNSFLIDRLESPQKGLEEMYRILKKNGRLVVVSPLNYNKKEHWQTYFPPVKLSNILTDIGFEIIDWKEDIVVNEPLDFRGNVVRWTCLGFVVAKR